MVQQTYELTSLTCLSPLNSEGLVQNEHAIVEFPSLLYISGSYYEINRFVYSTGSYKCIMKFKLFQT